MVKLADAKPKVGRETVKLEDIFDMLVLPKNQWVTVRLLDVDMVPIKRHWINIYAGKDKREVKIPKVCVSFDPETEGTRDGHPCVYDELADGGQGEVFYLAEVIDRAAQEDRPKKFKKPSEAELKSGFKNPDSQTWTPVKVVRITASLMKKIQGLKDLNKHKLKAGTKTFMVSHEKYGADISLKYNPDEKGANQYQTNLGDKCALTEEEQAYIKITLDADAILTRLGRETSAEAKAELKRMEIVGADESEDDDEDDDSIDLGKKSKKKKTVDEDDSPVKKKKPAAKSKKTVDDDDEDDEDEDDEDEDDEDEDDEDEDDEPVAKKKKPAAKSKKTVDEDEDDDEDDEDDEPVVKSKKPAAKSKKVVDEEEEEDDDDEPVVKSKKPAAKSKKTVEEEEEDDDDEPVVKSKKLAAKLKKVVDDEDDDDEPVVKSKKPAAKSKKVVDDDDDIPF